MESFEISEDELSLARSGDSPNFEVLLAPVKPYAHFLSRRYFLCGWDREDLYQEALSGFAVALLSFDPSRGKFHDYARLCMRNAVLACVRHATRDKRQGDFKTTDLEDLAWTSSERFRPDILVEQKDECDELLDSLQHLLSPAEWTVLKAVMVGSPLAEVAENVGVEQRVVENALSRARVKARRLLCVA